MATSTIDADYRIKYKHLFKPKRNYTTICTIKDEIREMLQHFNKLVDNRFYADDRILIEGSDGYLPRHGIIIEYQGKEKDFEKDFEKYLPRIQQLANKLEARTSVYECSFETEFCNKSHWVEFEGNKVAYNLSF